MAASNPTSKSLQNGEAAARQQQPAYADLVSPAVAAASVGIQSNIKRNADKRSSEQQAQSTGGTQ